MWPWWRALGPGAGIYSTVNKEGERTETDDKSPDCCRRTRLLASENYNCVQNTDSCLLKSKAKSDTKQCYKIKAHGLAMKTVKISNIPLRYVICSMDFIMHSFNLFLFSHSTVNYIFIHSAENF